MMSSLSGKRILLGVTGGIAAYKAAELLRLLCQQGAEVRVVMTRAATAFVTPLTFQALSNQPVHTELLDSSEESAMGHIRLARWPDLIVIAPSSADFIARLRAGLGDDLLSTICLATDIPIFLAPAMNRAMWLNPATQDNIQLLQERAFRLVGPAEGFQACGEKGPGRMAEPSVIVDEVRRFFDDGPLKGLRVVISAGPTREAIDPVRYISNRSSGKMGYSLATMANAMGADVVLVSGPTSLPPPKVAEFISVESASDMFDAVLSKLDRADIYIGVAAVADYAPAPEPLKIKKGASVMSLILHETKDILSAVSAHEKRPFTVGFAAETNSVDRYAKEKLVSKSLDMVAANQVGKGQGFDSDQNSLSVFWPGGSCHLESAPKPQIAEKLLNLIAERYHAKNTA